jgi:hypothetical protein
LTEKIPAEVDIHLCLSSTSRLGWNGSNKFSNSCSKAASLSERESIQSNRHTHTLWTNDPIIDIDPFWREDLRYRSGYKFFNVSVPIHFSFQNPIIVILLTLYNNLL